MAVFLLHFVWMNGFLVVPLQSESAKMPFLIGVWSVWFPVCGTSKFLLMYCKPESFGCTLGNESILIAEILEKKLKPMLCPEVETLGGYYMAKNKTKKDIIE